MNGSRFAFFALCAGVVSAAPGCAQITGLSGDYRHVTSGGMGTQGGTAGFGGSDAGSGGTSAGTAGEAGAGDDGGGAGSDAGGTSGGTAATGGSSAGMHGNAGGKGGASAGMGGDSVGAGGGAGGRGGQGAGGSAGNGPTAGMSGSAGAGNAWSGPVRIGRTTFSDSNSGFDDASGTQVDVTFEMPDGTQEGDFILVFIGVDHRLTVSNYDLMMQGWTLLDAEEDKGEDGQGTYLIYRFAGADEPKSIAFAGVNPEKFGLQGLLSVYRGVSPTAPVNAYDVAGVDDTGTDGPIHIETPTPEITTASPNCLLLAGLSPDSAVDAPVVTAWPEGFGDAVSVINPEFPRPNGWANIYLAERTWEAPGTLPASSFHWDITEGTIYHGAISFVLALAPAP